MEKKVPMRTCCGCRQSREKNTLIRIVRTPEGAVQVDPGGKCNGRGAYVCPKKECLLRAKKIKSLERSLGIVIDEEIYTVMEKELEAIETGK